MRQWSNMICFRSCSWYSQESFPISQFKSFDTFPKNLFIERHWGYHGLHNFNGIITSIYLNIFSKAFVAALSSVILWRIFFDNLYFYYWPKKQKLKTTSIYWLSILKVVIQPVFRITLVFFIFNFSSHFFRCAIWFLNRKSEILYILGGQMSTAGY